MSKRPAQAIDCTTAAPAPMPGLPNTGGGGGANGAGLLATLGAFGLGVAAVGALARQRTSPGRVAVTNDDER